jgi:hypothetical protein
MAIPNSLFQNDLATDLIKKVFASKGFILYFCAISLKIAA